MDTTNDTIAAIATAPGVGAIGVIRLSGEEAIRIADKIFVGKKLAEQASHTIHFGRIAAPAASDLQEQEMIDEVVVSIFKNPKSYTGEDVIEISGHGSPFILNRILEASLSAGARLAKPGEFTQRAFLNGKLDLAQAEAVADLIAADNKAAQQAALKQLRGGFSGDLKDLREQLINFAALIELELDFAEEDVEFADRKEFTHLIQNLRTKTQNLLDSFRLGNVIKNGVSVAIIGKPNAGKSTLLNALLNEERAIVSDIAGTTRDTIEEVLNINGILFRFTDTAGIREHTTDSIEQIGIRKAFEKIDTSSVLIYLADIKTEEPKTVVETVKQLIDNKNIKPVILFNKADLVENTDVLTSFRNESDIPVLLMSLKDNTKSIDSVQLLKQTLYNLVAAEGIDTENTIVTNARHYESLQKMMESIDAIESGMQQNLSGDLLTIDIRRCLHYLGEITGQVEIDRDILGTIFGKFCIGK